MLISYLVRACSGVELSLVPPRGLAFLVGKGSSTTDKYYQLHLLAAGTTPLLIDDMCSGGLVHVVLRA